MSATLLTNRPLAASESFTQAIRDRFNDREPIGAVRALVYADKAGTLYLEESDDEGAHYAAAATVSVSAATTTELAWTALTKRWYRFRYANSTTAQTNFRLIQQTRGLDVHKVDIGDSSIDTEAITGAGSAAKTLADVVTAIAAIDVEAITGAGEAAKTLADVISTLAAGISLSGSNTRKWATDTITFGAGAGAHKAGEVMSTDTGEILEFDTGLATGASGIILSSLLTLNQAPFANQAGYTLHLFTAAPTIIADDAAWVLVAAELATYIGKLDISSMVTGTNASYALDIGHNLDFTLASGSTKLYGQLVCKGTDTTVNGKIMTVNLGIAAL